MALLVFDPALAIAGGGLLDGVDVMFKEVRAVDDFDYNGTQAPGPAIRAVLVQDGQKDEVVQFWSMGKGDYTPANGGRAFETSMSLKDNTNAYKFIESVITAGFPIPKLGTDLGSMDGMVAHVIQRPEVKNGVVVMKTQATTGKAFPQTVMVVSKIHRFPWEPLKGKPGTGTKAANTNTAAPSANTVTPSAVADITEDEQDTAMELLITVRTEFPAAALGIFNGKIFAAANKAKAMWAESGMRYEAILAQARNKEYQLEVLADQAPLK